MRYLNWPLPPYPLEAWAEFQYQDVPVRVAKVVQSSKRVTGFGEVLEPLVVGPAISLNISPRAGIVPLNAKSFPLTATVHSNIKGSGKGTVKLDLPQRLDKPPRGCRVCHQLGWRRTVSKLRSKPSGLARRCISLTAVAETGGRQYREGYELTGYPGLRPYYLYRPSVLRTSGVDVKVAEGLNVGYIMGSGDDVPTSLESLGIHVNFLSPGDLATADLSRIQRHSPGSADLRCPRGTQDLQQPPAGLCEKWRSHDRAVQHAGISITTSALILMSWDKIPKR